MANSLYLAYKQEQIGDAAGPGHGAIDWEAAVAINAVLLDTADYVVDINLHADLADIAALARVATGAIASRTSVASGNTLVQDGANVTLSAVTGDQSEAVGIYADDAATEATKLLIAYFDTFTSGMPVTPNGGDININWNASGIFDW